MDAPRVAAAFAGGFLAALAFVMLCTYAYSYDNGYVVTVSTNEVGEFWYEVVALVGMLALGGYVAYAMLRSVPHV